MGLVRVKQQNPFLFEKIPDNEVLLCLMHYHYDYYYYDPGREM